MLYYCDAENDEVYGWDDLARWYRGHRWFVWGGAGLFFGWCLRGGFGQGGYEQIHATWVYTPPSPFMDFLGWLIQALGGLLLLWGLAVTLQRWAARRRRRRGTSSWRR